MGNKQKQEELRRILGGWNGIVLYEIIVFLDKKLYNGNKADSITVKEEEHYGLQSGFDGSS